MNQRINWFIIVSHFSQNIGVIYMSHEGVSPTLYFIVRSLTGSDALLAWLKWSPRFSNLLVSYRQHKSENVGMGIKISGGICKPKEAEMTQPAKL